MKKTFCMLCLCLFGYFVKAQQRLEWNLHTFGFADNREYTNAGLYSQSILGIRVAPEIGISVDSIHRVRFGINFLQEFGAQPFGAKVNPTAYYNYENKGVSFYLGAFPRVDLIGDYPRAVLNDTLMYYRPNIEGLFLRYQKEGFHQQLWVDWTSRQTANDREQFMVGLSGKFQKNLFFFSHHLTMLHTASSLNETFPVRDNMTGMLQLGLDLSKRTTLDSLTFSAGMLLSLDRQRGLYESRTPKGAIIDVHAAYRAVFLNNTFYKGQAHDIMFGDRFYTKDTYNRLDLGWKPFRLANLEGSFMLSLHFTPGQISNQQMLLLRYNLGGGIKLKD
ncbi:hypothetical protein H8S90_07835 [Olivibacter sp. SDN3]|uniref:hypothetical protein n=1 Tax=Olivibacter sp. SDN3 TaxID=2764720 RepID=UPI0016515A40|nr:hypothetical protein [Olivibacter sp. SDN3]QNL51474.1 hypothetical protein H8S90_07835 [Olivibacter sp. SDN3]